jgi:sugar/nucleoside kinase (ribokinase family)
VIHYTASAAGATADGSAEILGPHCSTPRILTGAGDHFNAGFALGQLLNLPLQNALCLATALSGYYVRRAESPSSGELATFLDNLPG